MALSATIFKAQLSIADMDRHYYGDVSLVVARHPSETDERMMQRIACFALYAHKRLEFTKGLSTEDEPDLWQRSLSGDIEHWIELGQPDEKRIRKACGRAQRVTLHCYSGNSARLWFDKLHAKLSRFDNLRVVNIDAQRSTDLAQMATRNMALHVTIEDQALTLSDEDRSVILQPDVWFAATD